MKRFTKLALFVAFVGFVSQGFAQNVQQTIDQQLNTLLQNKKISAQDMEWQISSQHTSSTSDVTHAYYRQVLDGLEIYGTESSVHVLPNGELLKFNNRFINTEIQKSVSSSTPALNAVQAVQNAATHFNYAASSFSVISSENNTAQESLLSGGDISRSNIPVKLVYFVTENEEVKLAWDLSIEEVAQQNWWSVRVDASTGEVLDQVNWMLSCAFEHDHTAHSEYDYNKNLFDIPSYGKKSMNTTTSAGPTIESYEVFAMPIESPYYGVRTIEVDPANATASPFGWHDTDGVAGPEFMVTEGNNVEAFEFGDNSGYQPDGGVTLEFVGYPFDQNYTTANQYEDASLTNLFYWSNIIHDVKYIYGFDEASGNFQVNNYGNGGAGNDSVRAEGQDGAGSCNATMGTPNDGSSPTMSMFICNNKDGSFDNLVIVHEYAHGTTNRLTGGGNNTSCLNNSEQMGEGWSDYYGVVMTIQPGDVGTDARGVGTYLFNQGAGGAGIRPFPYSTDLAVNPQTYDDIMSAAVPHGVGSVWCTTLWEVTWELIDDHGFDADIYNFTGDVNQDAGNVQAMALVTEALKLQPCSPGFVDGRDAILAADQAIYGGANFCSLWDAFAKRGLGVSADQGSSGSVSDGTEAFDSPTTAIETTDEVCVSQGVQTYGGGVPLGGTYSGPGVTDDGNGETYTFDPAAAGIGVHTITYNATSPCTTGSTATDDIEVTTDIPELTCQDVTLELDMNGEAILLASDVVTNLLPGGYDIDQTGTFAPIDITATGTGVTLADDAVSAALPIGFTFNFYGTDYTNFYISSNGFLSFQAGDNACCTGLTIPTAGGESDNFIAFAWEDINPSAGGNIRYETVGTAPDRKLVMEFDNVPFFGTTDGVTSQVHLFEGSDRIEIHSTDIPANGSVSQGIENQDGTDGLATPGRNAATWSATNDYVAFFVTPGLPAPNCGTTTTITLSQELFTCTDFGANTITVTLSDANGNTATCTPTVTITDPLSVCILGANDNELDSTISLLPNPTAGQLTLVNNSNTALRAATIMDVNGRTIQTIDLTDASTSTQLSVEQLATGMYFVRIDTENASTTKRIVKQ